MQHSSSDSQNSTSNASNFRSEKGSRVNFCDPASPRKKGVSRRRFLEGGAAVASAAALTGALSGCMKRTAQSINSGENTELDYFIANPSCIDPYNSGDIYGNMVARQVFDPLLEFDFQEKKLIPIAAERIPSGEEGGRRFVFTLKKDRTFQNGEPVNAQAFIRGWTRLVNPKTGSSPSAVAYYLMLVKGYDALVAGKTETFTGLSAPDDYTFVVELSAPFEDFPMITTLMCTAPAPEAALQDFESFYRKPIGNGAYEMAEPWQDGEYIRLQAYEDYQGTKPNIKKINFTIFTDTETAYREFRAGDIDICEIPTAQVRETEAIYGTSKDGYTITPGHQVALGDEPSVYYLSLNLNNKALADVNVRRALSLAIDRDAIVSTLFEGNRTSAGNLCPPGIEGYVENQWAYSHFDREEAEKLLDLKHPRDANGMRDLSFDLLYNQDGYNKEVMEAIQTQFKEVGVSVNLVQKEWAAFVSSVRSADFEISRNGWIAEYPSIDNILYSLCYTGNSDNLPHYSNAQVDANIMKARSIESEEERYALYEETNRMIGEDVPYIPIFFYKLSKVGSARIKYAYISPVEVESVANWEMTL